MKFIITEKQAKKIMEEMDDLTDSPKDEFIGKKVMVYYNLHLKTFSVTYKNLVVLHADYVKLKNVEFRVRPGGKEKVRKEKKKNVHAFLIGNLVDYCKYPCENIPSASTDKVITYDPYKYDSFIYKNSKEPIFNAKEVDMINLRDNKLFVINEIVRPTINEEIDKSEGSKFTYITLKPYFSFDTNRYYFNKVLSVPSNDTDSNTVLLTGNSGDFEFDRDKLFFKKDKSAIYVDKNYFDEKYPNFKPMKNSEKIGINSKNIKEALKNAFPEYWKEEDEIFTPGLRGIYTIGEKVNDDDETWSIMNYFDTKEEIHDLLYLKYKEENTNQDIVEWLTNLFKNNTDFTKLLVDRQWSSIENGLKLERESVDSFFNAVHPSNVQFYPHGSKMDRWYGVDVTIDGVNYQIKPLKSYSETNGEYVVNTYGMRDYTKKSKVNFIAYANKNEVLIFDNNDYILVSRYKVIHKQPPVDKITV